MALTAAQQSSRLFKKSQGVGETLVDFEFFSEPILGKDAVYPDQIWSQAAEIPSTAPSLANGASAGVVQYFEKLSLTHVPGSQNRSYQSDSLRDAIPFNLFNGPYNYALYKSDGSTQIPFGSPGGDWLVDTSAGLLTWYGTLPSGVSEAQPPKISFYKYVGKKGFGAGSGVGTILGVTAGTGLSGGGTQGAITINMNWGGTSSGLTFSTIGLTSSIGVAVDDTTIKINNDGKLTVVAGASSPVYDRFTMGLTTSGNDSSTGLFLSSTPNDYSRIQVFVNGQLQRLGNNSNSLDCYFGTQSSTPKSLSDLLAGDELYWNGVVAGYDLTTTDVVDIVYEA